MVKWVLLIIVYGGTPTAFAEYPSEALCKGAGEFLTMSEQDKQNNKWWCVPTTTWNGVSPVEPQEAPREEQG
jgi:hypothetical protein